MYTLTNFLSKVDKVSLLCDDKFVCIVKKDTERKNLRNPVNQIAADSTNIREYNLSQLLKLIHERGSLSRAAIVRSTHLSATAVSSIVVDLLNSGFVHEAGEGKSSGGRRPILLKFNPEARLAIGVDLGSSHVSTIVANLLGEVKTIRTEKFAAAEDPHGAIQVILRHLAEVMDAVSVPQEEYLGIGLAVPAPLEGENLSRLSRVILPEWEDVSLVNALQDRYDFPVYMDNDANAGAIAEKWWGNGRGYSNLAYIKVGVGVGAGLIINNEIFRGSGGTAGEIGHTTIDPDGPPCRCGNRGCMESYVGAPAVISAARDRLADHPDSSLHDSGVTLEAIISAARDGDPLAVDVVRSAAKYLGISISNLLNLVNPERIVIGGDLIGAGDVFFNLVRSTAFRQAISKTGSGVTIVTSQLGSNGIAVGAATLVIYYAFLPSNIRQTLNMERRR
jgi:glucokinase-like ROK family protein